MTVATTTTQLIHENRRNIIEALVPAQLSRTRFKEYHRNEPFRAWAESEPASCLRRFKVRDLGASEINASDRTCEEVSTVYEITAAYPADSRYGLDSTDGLEDAIRADHVLIETSIGAMKYLNYVSGLSLFELEDYEIEKEDNVYFLVARYVAVYKRATETGYANLAQDFARFTEDGEVRLTEAGEIRITEEGAPVTVATSATTTQLVREDRRDILEAITPPQMSQYSFKEYKRQEDFREWCEQQPSRCLRRFTVRDLNTYEIPEQSDMANEQAVTQFEITVAYPSDGRFGSDVVNGLEDAIDEDQVRIDTYLGARAAGDYVAGLEIFKLDEFEVEPGPGVRYLVARYDVDFRRAVDLTEILFTEAGQALLAEDGLELLT